MLPRSSGRAIAPMLILLSLLLSLAVAAPVAAKKNPPGNNGTVKVDGLAFDTHPNNEPHVGCTFEIDFYGFDAGVGNAEVIFDAHAPTGSGHLVTKSVDIGQDDNTGGGSEAGWDASVVVDLSVPLQAYVPHALQGYHVKLTVHAPGSQGADTKHKVFWVGPCDEPNTSPNTPPNNPPTNPPDNPPTNPPNNPPTNPPNNPPNNPPGGGDADDRPRDGTLGGNPPPLLPDTALSLAMPALALWSGVLLLGASASLVVVTARRTHSRRR